MVSTLPESFVARESIKDTWYHGFNDSEDVIVRFAVGTKGTEEDVAAHLQKENEAHKDLAFIENIQDYYITPTNKTLAMIVWAHNNVDFKNFMKMDPITFVHVNNMVSVLRQRPTTKGLYYGRMQYKKKPNQKSSEYNRCNLGFNRYIPTICTWWWLYIVIRLDNALDVKKRLFKAAC